MAKIVYKGITYSKDASALTDGSTSIMSNSEGIIELKSGYVKGGSTSGSIEEGVFRIYSGTSIPSNTFGNNGDIFLVRQS